MFSSKNFLFHTVVLTLSYLWGSMRNLFNMKSVLYAVHSKSCNHRLWHFQRAAPNKYEDKSNYTVASLVFFRKEKDGSKTFRGIIFSTNCLLIPITLSNIFTLADLRGRGGGRAGRTPPPTGPNSFVFTYIFTQKCLCQGSMPP